MKDIQKLFEEALENVTPKDWENACRHVVDIEKSYWDKDNVILIFPILLSNWPRILIAKTLPIPAMMTATEDIW